jgi:hypothetical protein
VCVCVRKGGEKGGMGRGKRKRAGEMKGKEEKDLQNIETVEEGLTDY